MPDYVLTRNVYDSDGHHSRGDVVTISEAQAESLVRNGWAEKKPGRARKPDRPERPDPEEF